MSKKPPTHRRRTLGTNNPLAKLGDDPLGFIPGREMADPTVSPQGPSPAPPPLKQISVRIPASLYKRLKISVARSGESQQDYLTRVISAHLDVGSS